MRGIFSRLPGMPVTSIGFIFLIFMLGSCNEGTDGGASETQPPNILFIIMDDVGVDQMSAFGYGGSTPPSIPTIDTIARNGVRFSNTWSMPACSPSRAVFFTGRFPSRTNVKNALGLEDLANAMVSPYEQTLPKLLKRKNYQSAIFGKFHIALQGNNPYGDAMPHALGWDYFHGFLDATGDPSSLDTTAGGVAPEGTFTCGYVTPDAAVYGACYQADGSCRELYTTTTVSAGRACRDSGGILDPLQSCQTAMPSDLNFTRYSSYFVNPLVINHEDGSVEVVPPTDPRARTYRATSNVDAAIDWIATRPADTPWMATLSFTTVHTPLQPPPADLTATVYADKDLNCSNTKVYATLSNQMMEAMDHEIRRLLVDTGIATVDDNGSLAYTPKASNTMIVIVGDNGTLGYTVKLPFDFSRAKGTAYQTGIWVPLIVAGSQVTLPDRNVSSMVNIADIYQLFAEIAGIDVNATVTRPLDSAPVMPYLTDPAHASIRSWNFSEIGQNAQADGRINGPCQFSGTCSHIPGSKSVCEDNGGEWWGEGNDLGGGVPSEGFDFCCEVQVWKADHNRTTTPISPDTAYAVRDRHYKLVRNIVRDYNATSNRCQNSQTEEFYSIDEAVPTPQLDYAPDNLLDGVMTPEQRAEYTALSDRLASILNGFSACTGDGNLDLRVDETDWTEWNVMTGISARSSWYDINFDGKTDAADEQIILNNLGTTCKP